MNDQTGKLILVDSDVLPSVFSKVLEAKSLLKSGGADTINAAAEAVGISRSAFYKYKDRVFPFAEKTDGRIVTLHVVLRDEAGVLCRFISALSAQGANILTISQNIPVKGRAAVSVSANIVDTEQTTGKLLANIRNVQGIVAVEEISGD